MKKALVVLAALGLVLAITGGAFAAKGLLTGSDIKKGSLTGANIANHTLGASLFTVSARNSLTGARGLPGKVGAIGVTGAVGANGLVGTNGSNGTNGSVGSTGAPGTPGTPGIPGTPGAPGAAGTATVFVALTAGAALTEAANCGATFHATGGSGSAAVGDSLLGSFPSANGTTASTAAATNPQYWVAKFGTGAAGDTAYAICVSN